MALRDMAALTSTLKNTSGQALDFAFIPPHGRKLAAAQEISIFGHVTEAINRGDRFGARNMKAFLNAVETGLLKIVSTPSPVLHNPTLGSQMLILSGSSLALANPVWEASLSS